MNGSELEADRRDSTLTFFVADTLSDDMEQLDQIVVDLNDAEHSRYRDIWQREFSRTEVAAALAQLKELGHVRVFDDQREERAAFDVRLENSQLGDLWFELTEAGRKALQRWSFPENH